LASLLRAANIPARIVFGFVYLAGAFGGHAWVEAFVRGHWVPLDAALPSDGPADAARLAVVHDTLAHGFESALVPMTSLLGRTHIKVLGFSGRDRKPRTVADAAPLYVARNGLYFNTGLGLSLRAPKGAHFDHLDAVWPDATLVDVATSEARVALIEKGSAGDGDEREAEARAIGANGASSCRAALVAGRTACAVERDHTAAIAFTGAGSIFVLQGRGAHALERVEAVARTVRIEDDRR
jgi:hypothetical protein